MHHGVRSSNHIVSTYRAHEQEVCGLKWDEEGSALASGVNENLLCIWDSAMSASQRNRQSSSSAAAAEVAPCLLLTQHKAAVKALD
jgi:cell division cycle protein 20 (cofactor of APC complex)